MISQAWLTEKVGTPSGKDASTYTKIYNKTGDYATAPSLQLLEELIELVNAFTWSQHRGAWTSSAKTKKAQDTLALNEFLIELKTARMDKFHQIGNYSPAELAKRANQANEDFSKEYGMVIEVLLEMQGSSTPLIANTGRGCLSSAITLTMMYDSGALAGTMSPAGGLQINALVAYNKLNLIGLLVHEYHHYLCGKSAIAGGVYLDEFAAHWKQYLVTKGPAADRESRAADINTVLQERYGEYAAQWQKRYHLVTDLSELGDFAVPNNAVKMGSKNHKGRLLVPA